MENNIVRTRMAPSPTGEFHIGGMRTLLFNYAFAKKNNGQFILRIEDTDRVRLVPGAQERLQQVIKDYGLSWDEGPLVGGSCAPYVQSERLEIYKKYALELIEKGHAYYCFCSKERLDGLRKEQESAGLPSTKYDKHCSHLSKEVVVEKLKSSEPYVIRMNLPENYDVVYEDLFLGKIVVNTNELDDQVLMKSDGFPTYHLAVVVDDHLMNITYIMRGVEWLPSTSKHLLLYKFFGWEPPKIGHLPNLKEVGSNKKLSKRDGDVGAVDFLKSGYLPEALLNFLMFLGWNPGTEKEIYSLEEFIQDFSLDKVHTTDLVAFDREKLLWLNGHYIRQLSNEDLFDRLQTWSQNFDVNLNLAVTPKENVLAVLGLIKDRMRLLSDYTILSGYFYERPLVGKDLLLAQTKDLSRTKEILTVFIPVLENVSEDLWLSAELDTLCHGVLTDKGFKPKEAFMTLRVALTGVVNTPPLFDVISQLGKSETLDRLRNALKLSEAH